MTACLAFFAPMSRLLQAAMEPDGVQQIAFFPELTP
jgi:hypothetical protein